MRTREFYVPLDKLIEFAQVIDENEITNSITGVTDDDEIIIEVEYEKSELEIIQGLEDLIYSDDEDDEESDD